MSPAVQIFEVSPRDGLQNEATILPTHEKVAHIQRLIDAGVRDIEVTSFVRPRWIPALADAEDVVARLPAVEGVRYWGLVPNQRGFDRAMGTGLRHVCTFLSASETHNLKNVNRTVKESLAGLQSVIGAASDDGVGVRAYVSTVFGCPYEGDVNPERVVHLAEALFGAGADVVVLGDTTGMALPTHVHRVLDALVAANMPLDRIAMHAHDTRGTALVNVHAAFEAGIRRFDGSVSGIGGCPYAPGAAGNAATEDLVYFLEGMGAKTHVDLERLAQAGWAIEQALGRELPGRYHSWWKGQHPELSAGSDDEAQSA